MNGASIDQHPVDMAGVRVTALRPDSVGRVSGLDLRRAISDAQQDAIDAARDRFAVLVFPGQALDDTQLVALGPRFGTIGDTATGLHHDPRRIANAQVNDISNLRLDGSIKTADDRHRMSSLGNLPWHGDSSFKKIAAAYSMLHARVIRSDGGDTEFADRRAACNTLPLKRKQVAQELVCQHSMTCSRAKIGFYDFSADELARCTPVPPRTRRRSLFLSAHIGRIQGWPTPEALLLAGQTGLGLARLRRYRCRAVGL